MIFKIARKKKPNPFASTFIHASPRFGRLPFFTSADSTFQKKKKTKSHSSHPFPVCNTQLRVAETLKKEKNNWRERWRQRICVILTWCHRGAMWCNCVKTEAEFKLFHVSWIKLCVLKVSRDLKSAHLPSWVIHRPGGSYLWPSSAFISSSVDNGSSNPVSGLSVRGAGIFLGAFEKMQINFQFLSANKAFAFSACDHSVYMFGKTYIRPPQVPPRAAREPER